LGTRKSPPSLSVDSRRSTYSRDAAIVALSSSRVVGMLEPTALICAPGAIHSRRRIGSAAVVAVTIRSAPRSACSAVSTASIGKS